MKLSRISLAVAAASLLSGQAIADELTVYGKANVSFQRTDEGNGAFTDVKSNASRFGVKGDYELENGLKAIYTFEWQVDLADESGEKNLKARNQFVGLKGNFGEVVIGRNDTMVKQSQGKIDLFSDYEADIKHLWKGENRMSDSVTFKSRKINGFQLGFSYIAEDEEGGESANSIAIFYGDKSLKKSKIYAAYAIDSDMKGYDATRINVQGKMSKLTLGAIYHKQKEVATGMEKDGYLISAAFSVNNKLTLKAQQQSLENDDFATFGLDYKYGKNTKLYTWYTSDNPEMGDDTTHLALGIEHKF